MQIPKDWQLLLAITFVALVEATFAAALLIAAAFNNDVVLMQNTEQEPAFNVRLHTLLICVYECTVFVTGQRCGRDLLSSHVWKLCLLSCVFWPFCGIQNPSQCCRVGVCYSDSQCKNWRSQWLTRNGCYDSCLWSLAVGCSASLDHYLTFCQYTDISLVDYYFLYSNVTPHIDIYTKGMFSDNVDNVSHWRLIQSYRWLHYTTTHEEKECLERWRAKLWTQWMNPVQSIG